MKPAIPTVTQLQKELADREAIRQCMYRYCRGMDRIDEEMLRSAYWPDAIDHHLEFKGNIDELIAWSFPKIKHFEYSKHLIGNMLIEINGNKADVESYFYGLQRIPIDGAPRDIIAAGRYLDKFEKRNDEWRIANRVVMTDWFRNYPDSADWTHGPFGMGDVPKGDVKPKDMSYTWMGWR